MIIIFICLWCIIGFSILVHLHFFDNNYITVGEIMGYLLCSVGGPFFLFVYIMVWFDTSDWDWMHKLLDRKFIEFKKKD